jgi:hypothetical protein
VRSGNGVGVRSTSGGGGLGGAGFDVAGVDSGARFAGFDWSPEKKMGPEILGAGLRILISEAKFVGSPGDAITLFTFWQFVSVFK